MSLCLEFQKEKRCLSGCGQLKNSSQSCQCHCPGTWDLSPQRGTLSRPLRQECPWVPRGPGVLTRSSREGGREPRRPRAAGREDEEGPRAQDAAPLAAGKGGRGAPWGPGGNRPCPRLGVRTSEARAVRTSVCGELLEQRPHPGGSDRGCESFPTSESLGVHFCKMCTSTAPLHWATGKISKSCNRPRLILL